VHRSMRLSRGEQGDSRPSEARRFRTLGDAMVSPLVDEGFFRQHRAAPSGMLEATPFSPNSTASTCAAFTTTQITMSTLAAADAGSGAPRPPSRTKCSTVAG
jgi:hypothetical protein